MACTRTPCAECSSARISLAQATEETQDRPYSGVIDRILEDGLNLPRKQGYTAKGILGRWRDEYDFDGGYSPSTSLRPDSTLAKSSRGSAPNLDG